MPTIPTSIAEITESAKAILKKLEKFPLDDLGKDFSTTLHNLDNTIAEAESTLKTFREMFAADAPLSREMQQTLVELSEAARKLRILADYLDRHPEALLRGKAIP